MAALARCCSGLARSGMCACRLLSPAAPFRAMLRRCSDSGAADRACRNARAITSAAAAATAAKELSNTAHGSAAGLGTVIVAFGGNALLKRGEPLTMDNQLHNARQAAAAVKELVDAGLRVCVTHGNGPQVGLLALQDPTARLEVLDAETEGQLGFILELELANALRGHDVAALLTQVVVDPADPAFGKPTKQVGPRYSQQEAEQLAKERGWAVAPDGDSFRRVVASPLPRDIVEWRAIQTLLQAGTITVCCGGGGIPVAVEHEDGEDSSESSSGGRRYGVEAVVDKDEASALLGIKLQADWLLMLTDADAIYDPTAWPREQCPLPSPVTCGQLQQMTFASGSMAPKVAAACRFVEATGGKAAVGSIDDALRILRGEAGTVIAR